MNDDVAEGRSGEEPNWLDWVDETDHWWRVAVGCFKVSCDHCVKVEECHNIQQYINASEEASYVEKDMLVRNLIETFQINSSLILIPWNIINGLITLYVGYIQNFVFVIF